MIGVEGFFAPLVSPFTDDGATISEIRLARQMKRLRDANVAGFLVCGDIGEFTGLGINERKTLTELVMRESQGLPVLVHVSTLSTSASLDLAQHASRHGARAAVIMPPYYGSLSTDEVVTFIRVIAQHLDLPLIVVDPEGELTDEIVEGIRESPNVQLATPLSAAGYGHLTIAKGVTSSDEFVSGGAVVTPLALLMPKCLLDTENEHDFAKLLILLGTLNRARVAKAALEATDIECGPPRGPLKPLVGPVAAALKALLE